MKRIGLILITASAFLCSCSEEGKTIGDSKTDLNVENLPSKMQVIQGEAQGTTYTVKVFGSKIIRKEGIDSLLQRIDNSMSNWNPNSMISQFNNGDDSVQIDHHFYRNLVASLIHNKATNNAFNPCVKPLLDYYGLGSKKSKPIQIDSSKVHEIVSNMDIASLNLIYGNKVLSLEESIGAMYLSDTIVLLQNKEAFQLDFNAIAQGYSVDVIGQYLITNAATDYLIELGGEMLARGKKPDGKNWRVAVDRPVESNTTTNRQTSASLNLNDKALATSGNYRNYKDVGGEKFHHTIDPVTGYPTKHNLLSATVLASNCSTADAMATSFMVMGLEKSKAYIENNKGKVEALLIYSNQDGGFEYYVTEGLKGDLELVD